MLILLISATEIIYEQARIANIAFNSVQCFSADYIKNEKSIYWRLTDSNLEIKREALKNSVLQELNQGKINPYSYTTENINIELKNYFIYKRIHIDITGYYPLFFNSSIFNLTNPLLLSASSEAILHEPPEFIRNIDLSCDFVKQSKTINQITTTYSSGISKLKDIIGEKGGTSNE